VNLRRRLLVLAALVLLGAQYAWYRANPNIWTGAQDGARLLRIGIEPDHPPFSFETAAGERNGFDVEIAHALCAAMQARCEFVPQGWTTLLAGLIAGKYDAALSSLPRPAASLGQVAFTTKYYSLLAVTGCCARAPARQSRAPWRLVARQDARPDLSAKLSGERLGVLRQATYGEFALGLYPQALIRPYDSLAHAGTDLAAGRIDLLLGDEAALRRDLLETPAGSGLVFLGPDIPAPMPVEAEAAIAVRGEDVDLREALERAIGAIRADGTYARISQRYFHADVYGG
jgi:arginine/ornithine transport system substrate-binding protein